MVIRCEEYPGTKSILIPAEGIAQEWITSFDEAKICKRVSIGIAIALVAWSRIMFVTPFFIGLNWDLYNVEFLERSDEELSVLKR